MPMGTRITDEESGLLEEGPWLIFTNSNDDIYLVNKDGSGLTQLPYFANS